MEQFTVENAGSRTWLVYELDDAVRDSTTQGMITHNRIPGLLPAIFSQADTRKFVKYDISFRVPAQQLLSGMVSRREIMGIFKGITDAMTAAEDYMITPSSLVYDTARIYTDVQSCSTQMVCLPVCEKTREPVDLLLFFKEILYRSRYAETEDNSYVAKLISHLNGLSRFSAAEFSAFLKSMEKPAESALILMPVQNDFKEKTADPAPVLDVSGANPRLTQKIKMNIPPKKKAASVLAADSSLQDSGEEISWLYLLQHYNRENAARYRAQQERKKAEKTTASAEKEDRAGQTARTPEPEQKAGVQLIPVQGTVFGISGSGNTAVLKPAADHPTARLNPSMLIPQDRWAYLIRNRTNERIPIQGERFCIGKDRELADYCISDNAAVSRVHAAIEKHGEQYFIIDSNSTNHTEVDGRMIPGSIPAEIRSGTRIRIADETFEFVIE